MNDNFLYNPSDLDIGAIMEEYTNKLIEILDLPEEEDTEVANDNSLLDTLAIKDSIVLGPGTGKTLDVQQLLTPSLSPSTRSTPIEFSSATHSQAFATDPQALANTPETPANELQTTVNLPAAPGN